MAKKPSKTSIALALSVSPARVTAMIKQGMPIDSVAKARAWKDANVRPRLPNVARRQPDKAPQAVHEPAPDIEPEELLDLILLNFPLLAASLIHHRGIEPHQAVSMAAASLFDLCAVLAMALNCEQWLEEPLPQELHDAIEGLDTDLTRQAIAAATVLAVELFSAEPLCS